MKRGGAWEKDHARLMKNLFRSFVKEEKGQTIIEYVMILALIIIVVIAVFTAIGKAANKKGDKVLDGLA